MAGSEHAVLCAPPWASDARGTAPVTLPDEETGRHGVFLHRRFVSDRMLRVGGSELYFSGETVLTKSRSRKIERRAPSNTGAAQTGLGRRETRDLLKRVKSPPPAQTDVPCCTPLRSRNTSSVRASGRNDAVRQAATRLPSGLTPPSSRRSGCPVLLAAAHHRYGTLIFAAVHGSVDHRPACPAGISSSADRNLHPP